MSFRKIQRKRKCNEGKESENGNIDVNYNNASIQEKSIIQVQDLKMQTSNLSEKEILAQKFEQFIEELLIKCNKLMVMENNTEESNGIELKNKELQILIWETAKLKSLFAMEYVQSDILARLLTVLEHNISEGIKKELYIKHENQSAEENRKVKMQCIPEKIMEAARATISALHVLTSLNLPINLFMEDVIDKIIIFTGQMLKKLIYPFCDHITIFKSNKKIENNDYAQYVSQEEGKKDRFMSLYNLIVQIISLISELLLIHHLTDNTVLLISEIAITPFRIENLSDLQFVSLKLAANVFMKYEMHRSLILNSILDLTTQLPKSKFNIRLFHRDSTDQIQLISGLVLQIVQNSVLLTKELENALMTNSCNGFMEKSESTKKDTQRPDWESIILKKYNSVIQVTWYFLNGFLDKCTVKNGETDCRALFENFTQDLLTVIFKPEWPVVEIFINLLGNFLVSNLKNKNTDVSIKNMYLDILGSIATKLRKETILAELDIEEILPNSQVESEILIENDTEKKKRKLDKNQDKLLTEYDDESLKILLLDYLFEKEQNESLISAQHFYVVKWYKEILVKSDTFQKELENSTKTLESANNNSNKKMCKNSNQHINKFAKISKTKSSTNTQKKFVEFIQSHKHLLLTKIKHLHEKATSSTQLSTSVDAETAEQISRYLAAKQKLCQNFYTYLQQILCALTENISTTRAKAIKCLTSTVEADPSLLDRPDVHRGVCYSFRDHSIPVREAAVDLVGKYILNQKDLFNKYYDMLSSRILDVGISVRKRVIKIFKDFCIKYPNFPKVPEICTKIIRRINDEEKIKKLVICVFQDLWFAPTNVKITQIPKELVDKVIVIAKVVASLHENEIVLFEQLLTNLFKSKENCNNSTLPHEPPKILLESCKEIVNCLVHCALRPEEINFSRENEDLGTTSFLLACLTTLSIFAKSYPLLLIDHISTLQPYLRVNCTTKGDMLIIKYVAQTLQHTIPFFQHPSQKFLSQLERDLIKLIYLYQPIVIENCITCLSIIVNKITRNFKVIRDIFEKYFENLEKYKCLCQKNLSNSLLIKYRPHVRRCLFTIGLLLRNFDFTDKDVHGKLQNKIVDEVFAMLLYFLEHSEADLPMYSLKAIGSLCIRHNKFGLKEELIRIQINYLLSDNISLSIKRQTLINLFTYLKEEESSIMELHNTPTKKHNQTNLKDIGNKSSETASKIVQLYCDPITTLCLHNNVTIRQTTLKLIKLVVHQGLIQPFKMIPYLISAATDEDMTVQCISELILADTEKKYPGVINMKSQFGFELSYKFQTMIQKSNKNPEYIRGFRSGNPIAINSFLYSIIRTSVKSRRALVTSLLKQFGNLTVGSLPWLLYIADNLAYFPYILVDEAMFVMHYTDAIILECGTFIIENFHETTLGSDATQNVQSEETLKNHFIVSRIDGDGSKYIVHIPQDIKTLQNCVAAIQRCILLIDLKGFLKNLYSIRDEKIMNYSPQKSTKMSEKTTKHQSKMHFTPRILSENLHIGSNILTDEEKKILEKQYLIFRNEFELDDEN